MKILIQIVRIIVSILFIISGLVKANDPLGLSYKMQEFFDLWNTGLNEGHFFAKKILISFFELLHQYSLALSVLMISLEIITGIALLTGWMKKGVLYLLLVLIVFFTFLTGYAYLSGKFTNCGCFGDCLPITPLTSFTKDLILLGMIIFLLIGHRFINPILTQRARAGAMLAALIISFLIQWYALHYLPPADCLPFKKGNNIAEQMKSPPGAVSDSTAIRYIYQKEGKRFEWAPEQLPTDFETYTYIDRVDKLIRKGNAEPRIKGFSLMDTLNQDHTSEILALPAAVLIFAIDGRKEAWLHELKEMYDVNNKNNIPFFLATSSPDQFMPSFARLQIDIPVYGCDFTVLRTVARTDPTFLVLKKGTIINKFSTREMDKLSNALNSILTR